jgi:hypothetical protein
VLWLLSWAWPAVWCECLAGPGKMLQHDAVPLPLVEARCDPLMMLPDVGLVGRWSVVAGLQADEHQQTEMRLRAADCWLPGLVPAPQLRDHQQHMTELAGAGGVLMLPGPGHHHPVASRCHHGHLLPVMCAVVADVSGPAGWGLCVRCWWGQVLVAEIACWVMLAWLLLVLLQLLLRRCGALGAVGDDGRDWKLQHCCCMLVLQEGLPAWQMQLLVQPAA